MSDEANSSRRGHFPPALIAVACNVILLHPRHLRVMGQSLVGSNAIALAALLVGLRQGDSLDSPVLRQIGLDSWTRE